MSVNGFITILIDIIIIITILFDKAGYKYNTRKVADMNAQDFKVDHTTLVYERCLFESGHLIISIIYSNIELREWQLKWVNWRCVSLEQSHHAVRLNQQTDRSAIHCTTVQAKFHSLFVFHASRGFFFLALGGNISFPPARWIPRKEASASKLPFVDCGNKNSNSQLFGHLLDS